MRTTIDLPEELLRRAKIVAVERGATLKEVITTALRRELESPSVSKPARRARFPIFPSESPGSLKLTGADIRRLEEDEDARRHGLSD
jgi:hypothetical protein